MMWGCRPSPTVGPEPDAQSGYGGLVAGPGNGGVFPSEDAGIASRCQAASDRDKKVITIRSEADGYVFHSLLAEDWTVVCNADTVLDARSEFLGMVIKVHVTPKGSAREGHLKEIGLREMRTMGEAGLPIKDITFPNEPVPMVTYFIDVPQRGRAINIWLAKQRADGMMVELHIAYLPQPTHPAWLRQDPVGGLAPLLETFELLNAAPEAPPEAAPQPDSGGPTVERPQIERPQP